MSHRLGSETIYMFLVFGSSSRGGFNFAKSLNVHYANRRVLNGDSAAHVHSTTPTAGADKFMGLEVSPQR